MGDDEQDPTEITWGHWTINVRVEAGLMSPPGDELWYRAIIDFHGDNDAGEKGLYGELSTNWTSLTGLYDEISRLKFSLRSTHEEPGDDDIKEHWREIHTIPTLEVAIARLVAAIKAEARVI